MRRGFGRRLHHFYEHHEKAFRTEIILVPVLVLTIKLFENSMAQFNTAEKIAVIIGITLACYITGVIITTWVGDFIWRRFLFRYSPLYLYRGVYVQVTGAEGRSFAISRIFVNYSTGKYIYRGVAFSESSGMPAAAWQAELTYDDRIDNHPVLYFTGESKIAQEIKYDPALFRNRVFSILCFTGGGAFSGAGFDFQRRGDSEKDLRSSFAIAGHRVDDHAMEQYNVYRDILIDKPFAVYQKDRDAIRQYALEAGLLPKLKPSGQVT